MATNLSLIVALYTGLAAATARRASHVAESGHPWPELGKCHLHHHACSAKEKNVEIKELYSDLFRILACIKLGPSQKNVEPGKLILKGQTGIQNIIVTKLTEYKQC